MKNNMLVTVIIVIFVAAGAFFAGMKYQQTQVSSSNANGQFAQGGQGGGQNGQGTRQGGGRRGGFGGATVGTIVSQDAGSITVQLMDGSSKIINISGSTTFSKTAPVSITDVKVGDRVAAFGTSNSDGSITAQNVQINPMMRSGQGGTKPSQSPNQ